MGTYTLIPSFSLKRFNTAEKIRVLTRFMERAKQLQQSDNDGDGPQVQSYEEGIAALNITKEQVERMDELIDSMESATYQGRGSEVTPEMQAKDDERIRAANYVVRRILDYDELPLATEREAALAMNPIMRPYSKLSRLPVGQRTVVIRGMIEDARDEKYSEYVETLGLAPYIDEAERLNNEYDELDQVRGAFRISLRQNVTVAELSDEAQDLLDDMCAMANAVSLTSPSEEVTAFILDTIGLFQEMRAERNLRGSDDDEDEEEDDDTTSSEPDTEEPDDKPVVQ